MLIGIAESDHLRVTLIGRTNPESSDFFDGNWLDAEAELKSGAFAGGCKISLRAEAFVAFRDELVALAEKGKGVARFAPMEPWLTIGIQRDCFEVCEAVCSLRDSLGAGNELRARFRIASSILPQILRELAIIIESYPVVGR